GFVGGRESEVAERTAQFVVLPADIAVYFIGASGSAPVDGAGFEFGEFSNNRGPIFDITLIGYGISPLGDAAHSKQPRKDAAMHLMGLRCAMTVVHAAALELLFQTAGDGPLRFGGET